MKVLTSPSDAWRFSCSEKRRGPALKTSSKALFLWLVVSVDERPLDGSDQVSLQGLCTGSSQRSRALFADFVRQTTSITFKDRQVIISYLPLHCVPHAPPARAHR